MINKIICSLFFFLFLINSSLADVFQMAPYNGFENLPSEDPRSQRILKAYQEFQRISKYGADQISPAQTSDFVRFDQIDNSSYYKAYQAFQNGEVIALASGYGSATRLGNPKGGKGAVKIANEIHFLDANIIRLAIDSQFVGRPIKLAYLLNEDNVAITQQLLRTMDERMQRNPHLTPAIKRAVSDYLKTKPVQIIAKSIQTPVINEKGQLDERMFRNVGALEIVETLFSSGAGELSGYTENSKVIFYNIDNDVRFFDAVAASYQAGSPDLLQVHVPTQGTGGSAYRFRLPDGSYKLMPLEEIEVEEEILKKIMSLNSNTVVLQGNALDPKTIADLPIPFEKKFYEGLGTLYLPKLSLSDGGKHPSVSVGLAMGSVKDWLFEGSKNLELLDAQGLGEIERRINIWNRRASTPVENYIVNQARPRTSMWVTEFCLGELARAIR
ncbi:MAG: hypothetical protein ACPGJV_07650 [Bacteriovoracaceae bacterium]